MSQKSTVHHFPLVAAPAPGPATCSSFGISSDGWRYQLSVCSTCCSLLVAAGANVPQHTGVLVRSGGCAREGQGAVPAGSSLHGAQSGFEEWLGSALNREACSGFVLFEGLQQVNIVILRISKWWVM